MIKTTIYNQEAQSVGEMSLSPKIFGVKVNEALVHQVVVAHMANQRQVLAHTKIRSEVRGGGKKPWKQKGTGRARAGSSRSPIWIGGGVVFGPRKDRNFKKDLNKKMNQKALMMALSDKVANNQFVIIEKLEANEFKTKTMNSLISKVETQILKKDKRTKRKTLVINANKEEKVQGSLRNLEGVQYLNLDNINILDVLNYKNILITKESVEKLEKRYAK